MITFTEDNHAYTGGGIKWVSATSFLKYFEEPFDDSIATKSSANKKSRWYGFPPDEIKAAWAANNLRARELGTWYHKKAETTICSSPDISKYGVTLKVVPPLKYDGGKRVEAPNQKLENNTVYPEHLCYLKSAGLCGQSDIVEVVNNTLYIVDFKSSKTIDKNSVVLFNPALQERKPKMMLGPLSHLECCNFNHYSLQLSLYMYMILRNNIFLKPGLIEVHHILFEEDGVDKYGDRIIRYVDGEPVVKEIVPIQLPYLKSEIVSMIDWYKGQKELKQAA